MVSLKYVKGVVENPINNLSILAFENCIAAQCFMVSSYKAAFHKATDRKKNLPERTQFTGKKIWGFFLWFWQWFFFFPLKSLSILKTKQR